MFKVILRKITGVIGAFGIGFGMLFTLQHYAGATFLLFGGLFFRGVQFILTPRAFRSYSPFGTIRRHQHIAIQLMQFLSLGLVILAAIFRLQHYPGVGVLNILGWVLLTLTMVIKALQNPEVDREEVDISAFGRKDK